MTDDIARELGELLCCPEGCVRRDDCWFDKGPSRMERARQVKALLSSRAADRKRIEVLEETLRWFINDIDGKHTVMRDFDAAVERARAALAGGTDG